MKKQYNPLLITMNEVSLSKLTSIVKETIAFDLVQPRFKKFTAADLWNIQRRLKQKNTRRFL